MVCVVIMYLKIAFGWTILVMLWTVGILGNQFPFGTCISKLHFGGPFWLCYGHRVSSAINFHLEDHMHVHIFCMTRLALTNPRWWLIQVKISKAVRDVYAANIDEKVMMKIGPGQFEPPSGPQKWILAVEGRDYKVWEASWEVWPCLQANCRIFDWLQIVF